MTEFAVLRPTVFDSALAEIREKSKKRLYQRDFPAWLSDVLGERMYGKMAEITEDVLFSPKPMTLIKSANGTGKTHSAARWVMWWVTAFPKEESLAICTAPTLKQVKLGVFAYLKESYGNVKLAASKQGRENPWPGWISEDPEWKYATLGGNQTLAVARVPGASDAVSTFQGLRKTGGRNFIELDEAGGVSRDIFTAIDALMTSGDSRMAGIGNPDRRGTPFYEAFTDARQMPEYNLHTISAYDLPTMTGEMVYPDEPEKQAALMKGLTKPQWIAHKERVWQTGGEIIPDDELAEREGGRVVLVDKAGAPLLRNTTGRPDGRFKAKVLGQFPDEDDHTFFPEQPITDARMREMELEEIAGQPVILGVDLATTGTDESVVMVNQGGRCRVFDGTVHYKEGEHGPIRDTTGTWSKEDELTNARRVHAIAKHLGATEVRLDAAGIGAGIATNLERLDEFNGKQYVVLRVSGGSASADSDRWANMRAQNHDWLREQLAARALDIDYDDEVLKDQLLSVTYDTNHRGAIQITPKKDMRSEMHGSPDRLDALIYAVLNTAPILEALNGPKKGDITTVDPRNIMAEYDEYLRGVNL
ncbi:hypothetical protein MRBLMI12_000423 [Microbacterium sp. LMI12-1-1.1]|uniref:hypothetical protein n=1 Tax=Microbacterium sp. LMI12-1-1.1 TaxID=3135225 RepID=UPI0034157B3C